MLVTAVLGGQLKSKLERDDFLIFSSFLYFLIKPVMNIKVTVVVFLCALRLPTSLN